jgi:hypothetical protein
MMSIFGLRIKEDRMKKAIKKTCVVLLLFALLVSQVAASYSETGTLNEGTSAISAAERYLSNWAYNSYMYADKNLTLGTVLDAEVDPAMPIHMLQARQHQRQIHIIILTFSMIIRDQMLGIV